METRPACGRPGGRDGREKANYQGLTPTTSLTNLDPADREIGRGHSGNDVLDSLYGEDYGLADPTALNLIIASVSLIFQEAGLKTSAPARVVLPRGLALP
jgi:hypothetical protein